MAEPFYRFGEWIVPPVVAMQGTKFTFHGLENIPQRGARYLPRTTPATWTGFPRCSPRVSGAAACTS